MSELSLFLIFILVCVAYYYLDKRRKHDESESLSEDEKEQVQSSSQKKTNIEGCCGAHEVCEKERLLNTKLKPEYYDDEELDAFAGRASDSYGEEEVAMFSNVFYTLKEFDVAGWLKSLQLRNIELPDSLKDEALLVIQERRYKNK